MTGSYLICKGRDKTREVFLCTAKHVVLFNRMFGDQISIWIDGISQEEGNNLVATYFASGLNWFGTKLKMLKQTNMNEGSSETGYFSEEDFVQYMVDNSITNEEHAVMIYAEIFGKTKQLITFSE